MSPAAEPEHVRAALALQVAIYRAMTVAGFRERHPLHAWALPLRRRLPWVKIVAIVVAGTPTQSLKSMLRSTRRWFLAALLCLGLRPAAHGGPTVAIAAASDLVFCLEALHAEFIRSEPAVALRLSTGSSGNFVAQITHGAPFDVFLSADVRYPRELVAAGAADGSSVTVYAIGRLVLWTIRPEVGLSSLGEVVRNPLVRRFALANPVHAPYGRAAREALERSGAWEAAAEKLILGENIAQAAQFVQTGNADAGLVARSLVLAPKLQGVGHWREIPADQHSPLEQAAVLTRRGAANPAAVAYLRFLSAPAARAIFARFGYGPVGGAAALER